MPKLRAAVTSAIRRATARTRQRCSCTSVVQTLKTRIAIGIGAARLPPVARVGVWVTAATAREQRQRRQKSANARFSSRVLLNESVRDLLAETRKKRKGYPARWRSSAARSLEKMEGFSERGGLLRQRDFACKLLPLARIWLLHLPGTGRRGRATRSVEHHRFENSCPDQTTDPVAPEQCAH